MSKNNIIQTIKSMEALWGDLMGEYFAIVQKYGLGYTMPKDESDKASEIMNHAEEVRKQINDMKKKAGIKVTRKKPESNAKPVTAKMDKHLGELPIGALTKQLATLTNVPALYYNSLLAAFKVKFLLQVERVQPDSASIRLLADSQAYHDWFDWNFKESVIVCIGLVSNKMVENHHTPVFDELWKLCIISNKIASYYRFKEERFGDDKIGV